MFGLVLWQNMKILWCIKKGKTRFGTVEDICLRKVVMDLVNTDKCDQD